MNWKEFLKPTLPKIILFVMAFSLLSYLVVGCTPLGLYRAGSMMGSPDMCNFQIAINPLAYLYSIVVVLIAAVIRPLDDLHLVIAIAVIGISYLISCALVRLTGGSEKAKNKKKGGKSK